MNCKIINKSKEFVTLAKGKSFIKIDWKTFNEMFDISKENPYIAIANDNAIKFKEETDEIIADCVVDIYMSKSSDNIKKMTGYAKLSQDVKKIAK